MYRLTVTRWVTAPGEAADRLAQVLAAHLAGRNHAVLVDRALPCWEVRSVVYVLCISSFKPHQEARELHGMTLEVASKHAWSHTVSSCRSS